MANGNGKKVDLSYLADKWPSSIVERSQVEAFTGGLVKRKTLANLDCEGEGPEERIYCGRRVGYRVNVLIKWLEQRSEVVKTRSEGTEL